MVSRKFIVSGNLHTTMNSFLFNVLLCVHGKQLRSCRGRQLHNHTVPGQLSVTVYPFFRQKLDTCVTRWTKQAFSCSKFLSPGVSFGQIQHLRGHNSIALGYLNFTAGLT